MKIPQNKFKRRWISTRSEYEWVGDQLVLVHDEGYWYEGPMALAHDGVILVQQAFRFYDSTQTAVDAQNADPTTLGVDTAYQFCVRIANTSGDTNANNTTMRLEYNHAGTGWTQVGVSDGGGIKVAAATAGLTDGATYGTDLLTGASGTRLNGYEETSSEMPSTTLNSGNYMEIVYGFQIAGSLVANNDNIDVRITNGGSLLNTYSVNPSITVSKATTSTKTATVNATKQKAGLLKTSTINAALQKAIEKTATINALIASVQTKQTTVNSILQKQNIPKTSTVNAALTAQGLTKSVTLNAAMQDTLQLTATVNAFIDILTATKTKTATVNAALFKQDLAKTATLSAVLQDTLLTTLTLNASLQATVPLSATVNAALSKTLTKLATVNAVLSKVDVLKTATVNAFIASSGGTLLATVNATLQRVGLTKTATVNALLLKVTTFTVTVNARVQKQIALAASLGAVLYGTSLLSAGVGARLIYTPGYWRPDGGGTPSWTPEGAGSNSWTPESGGSNSWA